MLPGLTLAHRTRARLAITVSGWEVTYRFPRSPAIARRAIWAVTGLRERSGDYPSQPFRRSRRTGNHRSQHLCGRRSFPPGHDAEASCGSRGKDPDSRTDGASSASFQVRPKPFPSFASSRAGGRPSGFSPPRVTPFPSGPKTFRRGVAALVQNRRGCKNPVCFSKACAPIRSGFLASDPLKLRLGTESRKHYLSTLSTGPAGTVDNHAEPLAIALREQAQAFNDLSAPEGASGAR